jgi:hypothetical protein
MSQPLPTYLNRDFALSPAQIATEFGAELLSLCQAATADGRLEPEEIAGLRQWLDDADRVQLPPARYLRIVIDRVLADGRITPEEYAEVYRAVEAVLPFDARAAAHAAWDDAQAGSSAATTPARASTTPGIDVSFIVAGVRGADRPALIAAGASVGSAVTLEPTRDPLHFGTLLAVRLPGGEQIGHVPASAAARLIPLLEHGSECRAQITAIRSSGRSPVPTVRAQVMADASLQRMTGVRIAAQDPVAGVSDVRGQSDRRIVLGMIVLAALLGLTLYFAG